MSKLWFTRLLDGRVRMWITAWAAKLYTCNFDIQNDENLPNSLFQEEYLHNNPFSDTEELENYAERTISSILYLTLEGLGKN